MSDTPVTDALRAYQQARAEMAKKVKVQPPGPNIGTLWRTIAAADNLAEVLDDQLGLAVGQLLADVEAICNE